MKKKQGTSNKGAVNMRLRFTDRDQFDLIKRASLERGLSFSAFTRYVAAAAARRILEKPNDVGVGDWLLEATSKPGSD